MPITLSKQEFRAPTDMLEAERKRLNITAPIADLVVASVPILGTWVNCDHATRGLVRVMIAAKGNEITVHGFGACSPTPCDWGMVDGQIYSDSVADTPAVAFTATYTFNFKQTIIVGHLYEGALFVETFDHFTDQSGRADYYSLAVMNK